MYISNVLLNVFELIVGLNCHEEPKILHGYNKCYIGYGYHLWLT